MTIETLVAAVDQSDYCLADKMNLQTDSLIGNQCGNESTFSFQLNGNRITYFHTKDRGVGRNRNLLLANSRADVCILADDDMRFVDGYPQIAGAAFQEHPRADILVFNLLEKKPRRFINKGAFRVRWYNYARYGAARLAFRRKAIAEAKIQFDLNFGGGTRYGSGEDTIFLHDCLKKHLVIMAVPYALAEIDQDAPSTWFTGYDRKFFRDKGALFARLHPDLWPLFALRFLIRYRQRFRGSLPFSQAFLALWSGGLHFRKEQDGMLT